MGKGVGKSYLTDVSDEEWAFVLPYLLLSRKRHGSTVWTARFSLGILFEGAA